jgi:sulfatase maturation enzyme AslB (radical SAM superfamily)
LKNPQLSSQFAARFTDKYKYRKGFIDLMVWLRLNVSNTCNFACRHCHVFKISENKLPSTIMSYHTMDLAMSTYLDLMKNSSEKELVLSIYGGETLINNKNLIPLIEKYGNNSDEIKISWLINTNGSLMTEEIADFFRAHDVDVHLSCDGSENTHNSNRVDKFGNPTFAKVENALSLIKEKNLKAQINSFVMPENCNSLREIVDIASEHNIHRIYLDFFYSKDMIKAQDILSKYLDVYSYGIEKGVSIAGPWTNVMNRIGRKTFGFPPNIDVNVDGTFFFNSYPMTRTLKMRLENLNLIISSLDYRKFQDSVIGYFNRKCSGCCLKDSCCGSAITQYQYHTVRETSYEQSCDLTREIIRSIRSDI